MQKRPIIFSYSWPMEEGGDKMKLVMNSPNVIDIPYYDHPKQIDAINYWQTKGKIILARVKPFQEYKSEQDIYNYFEKYIKMAQGISIDEIKWKITSEESQIMLNVLKNIRKAYPDKIITVWSKDEWYDSDIMLLRAIENYADIFIPEMYISESRAKKYGFGRFKKSIGKLQKQMPGILEKTLIGISVHPDMNNQPDIDFGTHIIKQIQLIKTDPLLRKVRGIAIYAPVYLSAEDQARIDMVIKKYFSR